MTKISSISDFKFPKTLEEPSIYWRRHDWIFALVETKELVKIYGWDMISETYNSMSVFEKLTK